MNTSSFPTIRMVNTFQVEKENHRVVLDVERELEDVVIQLRTSDLPSYHHATILEQYKKISMEFFIKQFGPVKRWSVEVRSLFYYLGRCIDRKIDAATMEAERPGPLRRAVDLTVVSINVFSTLEK